MPDMHIMMRNAVFSVSLQALQIGHLVLFYLFAEQFSWWNYVSWYTIDTHSIHAHVHVPTVTWLAMTSSTLNCISCGNVFVYRCVLCTSCL